MAASWTYTLALYYSINIWHPWS